MVWTFSAGERGETKEGLIRTKNKLFSKLRWTVPLAVLFLFLNAFIPTRNEMVVIIAGGKTLDYVQSDTSLKKIPYQATSIISEYLDKTIRDIKGDTTLTK